MSACEFWMYMGKAFAVCIAASALGMGGCWLAVRAMGPTGEGE